MEGSMPDVEVKKSDWRFPFGEPVQKVIQTDRTPKQVFVLGVYASAVHAQWVGKDGKTIVRALAVASEPYIFWRGDRAEAESIVSKIRVPEELGTLSPASDQYNGPSGKVLDKEILEPLRLERNNVWLCDLVPHSCVNSSQKSAIERSSYSQKAEVYGLPQHTVPPVPTVLADKIRRKEILVELSESNATTLVLLGDKPIEWFLQYYDDRWKKLADFGREDADYGKLHPTLIDDKVINVLPLAHPRQIAKLGQSSITWCNLHTSWVTKYADKVIRF